MNKIKEKRLEANLRLVDLARLGDLSIATLWNLENGLDYRAKPETRRKIVTGLRIAGLNVDEKDVFPE